MAPLIERLGILGGTFNPITVAHLLLAQEAWYRYELSRLLFVPAARNPLKDDPRLEATDDARLAMLRLATENDSRFVVDAWELRRGGMSYTIDTLRRLRTRHPESELYLLVGADSALTLPQWKDIQAYPQLCTVVICNRPGSLDLSAGLPPELAALGLRCEVMPLPQLDISSHEVRRRVRQGKPVRYFVPDAVADFIHQHGLYR